MIRSSLAHTTSAGRSNERSRSAASKVSRLSTARRYLRRSRRPLARRYSSGRSCFFGDHLYVEHHPGVLVLEDVAVEHVELFALVAVGSPQAQTSGISSHRCTAAVHGYVMKRMAAPTRRSRTAQNSAYELVAVEDVLSSVAIEAGEHARDLARLRIHGVFPASVLGRRSLAKAVLRAPSLRTGEANLDTSRCADDGHGDALHHPRWRQYLLCPFAQRFLKGIPSGLDMDIGCAIW